jgi:hypothetical protein
VELPTAYRDLEMVWRVENGVQRWWDYKLAEESSIAEQEEKSGKSEPASCGGTFLNCNRQM